MRENGASWISKTDSVPREYGVQLLTGVIFGLKTSDEAKARVSPDRRLAQATSHTSGALAEGIVAASPE